jgi:NAD(P)H-dependent flavin oxidoreductase YrpB (nitropropane dioxygenase family)
MNTPLAGLGVSLPVIAAPMAGGPSTTAMVIAAAQAGALGFLAAGYKSADVVRAEIEVVKDAGIPFGMNVFAPNPVPIERATYREYATLIQREADRFGLTLPADPIEDDDSFAAKIDLLLHDPVPVVSFTFGIPDSSVIRGLQAVGTVVVQTVTSADEAERAADVGVDMLAVQSASAGGHSGTLTPRRPSVSTSLADVVSQVRQRSRLPIIAAGGVATAGQVTGALQTGADAVAVGTVLLLASESGASATHQAAIADPARTETVVTRAFTGRPARGLRNTFIDAYEARAPLGYPAIHYLTSPLRKAAAAAGEPELVHLWAGTGFRHASKEPTGVILERLVSGV